VICSKELFEAICLEVAGEEFGLDTVGKETSLVDLAECTETGLLVCISVKARWLSTVFGIFVGDTVGDLPSIRVSVSFMTDRIGSSVSTSSVEEVEVVVFS
jgi:hypothetical protein